MPTLIGKIPEEKPTEEKGEADEEEESQESI